ncbi:hypothetical protein BO71DRAFT_470718 [Aspergillus ellipticus CBS 707.79]|uniref:Uncharacterized protein n=1 Tax=Aspergillus ellipticus CBS 707.79 TaxID=1448320 RepID=A0A319DGT3_9EURO|nr:hypothetical protein BO71DRAFT_470718 [Aspergillus ellipticus CBS 707.79]
MANPTNSLLQYARFHGIASDFINADPLKHVNESCGRGFDFFALPEDGLTALKDHFYHTQKIVEHGLHSEKLDIRREGARYLSSILRDTKANDIDEYWDKVLPAWGKHDNLKLEPPIFDPGNDNSLMPSKDPVRYSHENYSLHPPMDPPSDVCDANLSKYFTNTTNDIEKRITDEKLDCTKASLMCIQNARHVGNCTLDDLENLLETSLGIPRSFRR